MIRQITGRAKWGSSAASQAGYAKPTVPTILNAGMLFYNGGWCECALHQPVTVPVGKSRVKTHDELIILIIPLKLEGRGTGDYKIIGNDALPL